MITFQKRIAYNGDPANSPLSSLDVVFRLPVFTYALNAAGDAVVRRETGTFDDKLYDDYRELRYFITGGNPDRPAPKRRKPRSKLATTRMQTAITRSSPHKRQKLAVHATNCITFANSCPLKLKQRTRTASRALANSRLAQHSCTLGEPHRSGRGRTKVFDIVRNP